MSHLQEEAIRAVSAALSDIDTDLLSSVESLQEQWQQELSTAKATARSLLANILTDRESLRSSLRTAAQLWRILRPVPPASRSPDSTDPTPTQPTQRNSDAFLASAEQLSMVKTLQNVSHTIFYLEFITAAPDALQRANGSLEKLTRNGMHHVVVGNAAMLVDAHALLTAVERLRDLILLESPTMQHGDEPVLPWFAEAEDTRRTLEAIVLRDIFSDIVRISQQNPRLLVAAARIVQSEEAEDVWWSRHLERSGRMHQEVTVRPFWARQYRKRALDAVVGSLRKMFMEKEKELGIRTEGEKAPNGEEGSQLRPCAVQMADVMEWIENRRAENETVRRFVVPCLPPSFYISALYEKELHRQFMRLITRLLHLVKPNGSMMLSETDLMMLTTWYCRYKEEVGEHEEDIDSFLTDEDRERLISALQKHCASRISTKMIAAISEDRTLSHLGFHDVGPLASIGKTAGGGKAGNGPRPSDLPDVVLGCINDQVRRMLALRIQGMDQAIAETSANCLMSFQNEVREAMESEAAESSEDRYRLYACSTANNMARCLEHSEDLRDLFIPIASDRDRSDIEEMMERVIEGFRASASLALKVLIRGMDSCLRPHARRLFAPHTGTEIMLDIVATLEDYFSDCEAYLLPYHFEHLAIESLKRVVVWYLAPFLRLGYRGMEESAARRVSSFPNFGEKNRIGSIDSHGEGEDTSSTRTGERQNADRKEAGGLRALNGAAVVAQIDKDRGNLAEFMTKKVVLYQKKQLQPALEPLQAIRLLYTCPPTTFALSDTFKDAKAVISRALRPTWVSEFDVPNHVSYRMAEKIWESRKDVNPVVLLEAVSLIRSIGERLEAATSKDCRLSNFDEGRLVEPRTSEAMGSLSDRMLSYAEGFYQDPATFTSSLLWAPSTSRSFRSRNQ